MVADGAGAIEAVWSYGLIALLLLGTAAVLWQSGLLRRVLRMVEETLAGNWQLAVLGAAAIALSLASGYTTFDGLRNFTSAPLLSVLVAFGIQGVLLIVSWLIGESFAAGMGRQAAGSPGSGAGRPGTGEARLVVGLGAVLVGLAFCWALGRYNAVAMVAGAGGWLQLHADWPRVGEVTLAFLTAVVAIGLAVLALRRGGDIARPYAQAVRIIAKDAMLWVMLLACMSASVLFSFDSHFNAIFPFEQRSRAAEVRTLDQVSATVADIGERLRKVQAAETALLLASAGWKAYDAGLAALAELARGAQGEIAAVLLARLEERERGVGEQQERIAGAERSQSALLRKRDELEAELQRLEVSIGALEAELAKAQAAYDERKGAIAAKEIEAAAEDGGVEGSLKRGKGPTYRQRVAEAEELQRKLKLADEPRLKEAQGRRDAASTRIVGLKREIATIVAEAAKYKGTIAAAETRIKAAEADGASGTGVAGARAGGMGVDAARLLDALEQARTAFRQRPGAEALAAVEAECRRVLGTLSGAALAGERVRAIRCEPQTAAQAAARLFALNAGRRAFEAACAGGAKLPQPAGTDALLTFGRRCLQESGLASKDTADLAARFQAIELSRDDKAHRFVVTWNAVLDGNRLAYLALVLAIGVDSLVFMAGLFGAAAARSPLSDVPSLKPRSAERLEAIVRNALGEDRTETATLVLAALQPAAGSDDERSEVDLAGCDAARAERIRRVLVAGRSIGAVERAPGEGAAERYLVRPELIEFLAAVANAEREGECKTGREPSDRARLAELVGMALEPDRPGNAALVLRHADPMAPRRGFVARVNLDAVAKEKDRRLVHGVLGAAMSVGAVAPAAAPGRAWQRALGRSPCEGTVYLISTGLFETLLLYRASAPTAPRVRKAAGPGLLKADDGPSDDARFEDVPMLSVADRRLLTDDSDRERLASDDEDPRRRIRDALLKEVAPALRSAALARCSDAERPAPGAALERLGRDAMRALQRAANAVGREHVGDARALARLDETHRGFEANLPRLLARLLDDLIGEAESSGDDVLRGRLESLRDGIAGTD